jgi:hypothetical protein
MGNGRFAYQQTRWFRKSFTLLRWCNAWMFRALTTLQMELKNGVTREEP